MPRDLPVEAWDLVRRMGAYDGPEPDDWRAPVAVPMGLPAWTFTLAELDRLPLARVLDLVGDAAFQRIVETQGFLPPQLPGFPWKGSDRLPVYGYLRGDGATTLLVLVASGEYQPGRWKAHIEGFWRIGAPLGALGTG